MPATLRQIIFKVAQPCNLNCDYCYVYNMGDSSWRNRPKLVGRDVVLMLGERIRQHMEKTGLQAMTLELHGGEPLLLGRKRMRCLLDDMTSTVGAKRLRISVQTNGLLLTEAWIDLFHEYGVEVGISLDGPASPRSHRVDKKGQDATPRLLELIARFKKSRPEFRPGTLAVLSDNTDVVGLVDWFPSVGIPSFDLLFPLGNYVTPPVGILSKTIMAKKLIDGFDYWYSKGETAPQIRLYELIIKGFLGHEIALDALGGDLHALCVVETDGSIGMSDVVRFLGGRFANDDLSIFDSPLMSHAEHFAIPTVQRPCSKCQSCEVFNGCGGGYLPDRFDGETFNNPSYYCDVLFRLCEHVMRRLEKSVPAHAWTYGLRYAG